MTEVSKGNLSYYMTELTTQTQYAVIAGRHLNDAYAARDGDDQQDGITRALAAIQALLGAAAVISKLLWTSARSARAQERAAALREALDIIDDDFPLLRNRSVRDSLEHIDERIDGYLAGVRPPLELERILAGLPPPARYGNPVYLRRLDPARATVEVLGRDGSFDDVPVSDLISEIDAVQKRVNGWFVSELAKYPRS